MLKSHGCGEIRLSHVGQKVQLAGWVHRRRDHGGVIFIDLRDTSGRVQIVIRSESIPDATKEIANIRDEYVLMVIGEVHERLEGSRNDDLPTGDIEIKVEEVEVLNSSKTPPFPINQEITITEATRLHYRYLDLRRDRMASNIQLRHKVIKYIRDFLDDRDFIEIETPVLGLATPEGARDYLVPSRVHPSSFYALPQSPQQWKQLLMVSGFERYFQIVKCYRDEDLRADRQPEFTQLDLEMSFVNESDVMKLNEELIINLLDRFAFGYEWNTSFPQMTYATAMEKYGTDRPDLRYGLEINDYSDIFRNSEFKVFSSAIENSGRIRGIIVPGGAEFSRKTLDHFIDIARETGAAGLIWIQINGSGPVKEISIDDIKSPAAKFLSVEEIVQLADIGNASRGDLIVLAADKDQITSRVLDVVRRDAASKLELINFKKLDFVWITEFPLFEWDDDESRWSATHHLFTAPLDKDKKYLDSDPSRVRSRAYDVVCNGQEIGGGSIRIHKKEDQLQILDLLGISTNDANEKFGHMLDAFEFGAPPHGGIAWGMDRTVALIAGEQDIREVIAFPKTKSAVDLVTGAPAKVSEDQLHDVHITVESSDEMNLSSDVSEEI
ncbi:MAG: aspartate--tRNA ligase [Dehalococcoidia bacterium]